MKTDETQNRHDGRDFCINHVKIACKFTAVVLIPVVLLAGLAYYEPKELTGTEESTSEQRQCYQTCRVQFVASIPDNVTFGSYPRLNSTFDVWYSLIRSAKTELLFAAYKTSLRGMHVLDKHYSPLFSKQGNVIHDALLEVGLKQSMHIRMIENYPPKDVGDNEDGISFANTGTIKMRSLNLRQVLGQGTMHTKFIISDSEHFYIGSANLDWRSLNQKLELGAVIENCPCLAKDLSSIFDEYWEIAGTNYKSNVNGNTVLHSTAVKRHVIYNQQRPLSIFNCGAPMDIYVAASPRKINGPGRSWDLDAILNAIENAQNYLYIEVMDYFPMFIYNLPRRYWPEIDNFIRRAIFRGVEVKMLTAAIHFPELSLKFLCSLEKLNGISPNGSIQAKIFKVPTDVDLLHIMVRERRMHTKFLVTETVAIIGTSNWSGDYFDDGTTGVALVLNQTKVGWENRHFIHDLRQIFLSHWSSNYTHDVQDYERECLQSRTGSYCETEKHPSLLAA